MDAIFEFFGNLTNAEWIMAHGGMYIILAIIFAETGLLLGFILPGDFLIFLTGTIIAAANQPFNDPIYNLIFWELMMIIAAVTGNMFGYWFGKKSGNFLFERKDTWYLKKKHIVQAKEFYERKGGGAILLARFVPIVRTFAPIIAGVVRMPYGKFMFYNIMGAILWIGSLCTIGFFIGRNPWVERNLEYIILGMIVVATAPVLIKMFFPKKEVSVPKGSPKMGGKTA